MADDPPPPYSSLDPIATASQPRQLPVYNDELSRQMQRRSELALSMPDSQFDAQSTLESERIFHQVSLRREGRKETVPFDRTIEFDENAENNVRARWVAQKIWRREWGLAWPPRNSPNPRNNWGRRNEHPDVGFRWGHEPPPLPPTPPPRRQPQSQYRLFGALLPQTEPEPEPEPEPTPAVEEQDPDLDPEASRPYPQFLAQVEHEKKWIQDEHEFELMHPDMFPHRQTEGPVDFAAEAYKAIKSEWVRCGIWDSEWGEFPGDRWKHEVLREEQLAARNNNPPAPAVIPAPNIGPFASPYAIPLATFLHNARRDNGGPGYEAAADPPAPAPSTDWLGFQRNILSRNVQGAGDEEPTRISPTETQSSSPSARQTNGVQTSDPNTNAEAEIRTPNRHRALSLGRRVENSRSPSPIPEQPRRILRSTRSGRPQKQTKLESSTQPSSDERGRVPGRGRGRGRRRLNAPGNAEPVEQTTQSVSGNAENDLTPVVTGPCARCGRLKATEPVDALPQPLRRSARIKEMVGKRKNTTPPPATSHAPAHKRKRASKQPDHVEKPVKRLNKRPARTK